MIENEANKLVWLEFTVRALHLFLAWEIWLEYHPVHFEPLEKRQEFAVQLFCLEKVMKDIQGKDDLKIILFFTVKDGHRDTLEVLTSGHA